jgi:UV DNA damage repair endonuclease
MNDETINNISDSIREAVIQAKAAQAETVVRKNHIRMKTTPDQYDPIGATEIEVTKDSIQLLRCGAIMRTYMTKEEALQLAANLIAIHTD